MSSSHSHEAPSGTWTKTRASTIRTAHNLILREQHCSKDTPVQRIPLDEENMKKVVGLGFRSEENKCNRPKLSSFVPRIGHVGKDLSDSSDTHKEREKFHAVLANNKAQTLAHSETTASMKNEGGKSNLKTRGNDDKNRERQDVTKIRVEKLSTKKPKNKNVVYYDDDSSRCRAFPYGAKGTLVALVLATFALSCSLLAKRSTSFVNLQQPLGKGNGFEPLYEIGIYRATLCTGEKEETSVVATNKHATPKVIYETISKKILGTKDNCVNVQLDLKNISGWSWDWARAFAGLSVLLGTTSWFFLIVASFVDGVNLAALSFTMLFAYFFNCLTFLVFDSPMCRELRCGLSSGAVLDICSCASWIVTGLATLRLNLHRRARILVTNHKKENISETVACDV